MKRILAILLALVLMPFCYAAENLIATAEPQAGITPDQGILYGIDTWIDDTQISMQSDPEKRIEAELKIADERAAEYRDMKTKMKEQDAEKALMGHDKLMNEVESDKEKLTTEEKKAHVLAMISKHQAVLEGVKARIMEKRGESPSGLDNAIANAKELQEKKAYAASSEDSSKCQSWEKEDNGKCIVA
jgi:hypothetical protein